MKIAVVGAHLSGLPLNHQLLDRDAKLVRSARTKPIYQFFALPGTVPPKPGLVRTLTPVPTGIEVEIWELGTEQFGNFVDAVPPPLVIGTLELEDDERVKGFLVESYAVTNALDITSFGGWRNYLKSIDRDKRL